MFSSFLLGSIADIVSTFELSSNVLLYPKNLGDPSYPNLNLSDDQLDAYPLTLKAEYNIV